ncbi:MAG: YciI family protein [Chloroflexi bacterium]|nr:YciI family protein [Chloroflexota bacterium]MBV9896098.1 YciI family protein [Chloroflexota bacterium]
MPKYAVLIFRIEDDQPEPGTPESRQLYQAWGTFNRDVAEAGVMTSGTGLQASATATSVRVRNGKTMITDGPFAETREQLGGVLIFDCKDLDEAIMWASKVPDAQNGCIEVRPLWEG